MNRLIALIVLLALFTMIVSTCSSEDFSKTSPIYKSTDSEGNVTASYELNTGCLITLIGVILIIFLGGFRISWGGKNSKQEEKEGKNNSILTITLLLFLVLAVWWTIVSAPLYGVAFLDNGSGLPVAFIINDGYYPEEIITFDNPDWETAFCTWNKHHSLGRERWEEVIVSYDFSYPPEMAKKISELCQMPQCH